jgi:hypothetical protein
MVLALLTTSAPAAKPAIITRLLPPGNLSIATTKPQQEAAIVGSVRDASSHETIADATVVLAGSNLSTRSKADGSFQLLVPEEQLTSFFELIIIAPGYKSKEVKAAIAAGIPRLDVLLRKKR